MKDIIKQRQQTNKNEAPQTTPPPKSKQIENKKKPNKKISKATQAQERPLIYLFFMDRPMKRICQH